MWFAIDVEEFTGVLIEFKSSSRGTVFSYYAFTAEFDDMWKFMARHTPSLARPTEIALIQTIHRCFCEGAFSSAVQFNDKCPSNGTAGI
jgi:hypothetical protein